jgi:hypothetical protein
VISFFPLLCSKCFSLCQQNILLWMWNEFCTRDVYVLYVSIILSCDKYSCVVNLGLELFFRFFQLVSEWVHSS